MLPIYTVIDINTGVCWDGQQFSQLIDEEFFQNVAMVILLLLFPVMVMVMAMAINGEIQ